MNRMENDRAYAPSPAAQADPPIVVRKSYDHIAAAYLTLVENYLDEYPDMQIVHEAMAYIPDHACVLDVGCGPGEPFTRMLSERFLTFGLDFSAAQLALAATRAPKAHLIQADMRYLCLKPAQFDAIFALYTLFHIPRDEQPAVLRALRDLLKPNGLLLAVLGVEDRPGDYFADPLGPDVSMYKSHFDAAHYRALLPELGFTIVIDRVIDDPVESGQQFFVLVRRSA